MILFLLNVCHVFRLIVGVRRLLWETDVVDGSGMNMYVSARDLALWGYLHLREG